MNTNNDLEAIKARVRSCINNLYEKDKELFIRNKRKGLCERCLAFRFGYYLQLEFKEYLVDSDFNSSYVNGQERPGKGITNSDGTTSTDRFVDFIVHKRTSERDSDFICFEIKKWNNYDKEAIEKDQQNLKILTSEYGYKYGFYLILGKDIATSKWIIYQGGNIIRQENVIINQSNSQV